MRVPVALGDGSRVIETWSMTGVDVDVLRSRLAEFAAARDWQVFHTPKNLAMALVVEAGELVEIFQWLTPEESSGVSDDPALLSRARDEVADILAYLLQFADSCGIDPLAALAEKIERNEKRFPVVEDVPEGRQTTEASVASTHSGEFE
jgi:NTP pyrophosphatase (non-canonical NTP hydrolase)